MGSNWTWVSCLCRRLPQYTGAKAGRCFSSLITDAYARTKTLHELILYYSSPQQCTNAGWGGSEWGSVFKCTPSISFQKDRKQKRKSWFRATTLSLRFPRAIDHREIRPGVVPPRIAGLVRTFGTVREQSRGSFSRRGHSMSSPNPTPPTCWCNSRCVPFTRPGRTVHASFASQPR